MKRQPAEESSFVNVNKTTSKQPYIIEATVFIEPMPCYRKCPTYRRRRKRRDHRRDDVPDAPSLKDIDFEIDPPPERPREISPYEPSIVQSPASNQVTAKEFNFYDVDAISNNIKSNPTQRNANEPWLPQMQSVKELKPLDWPICGEYMERSSPIYSLYTSGSTKSLVKKSKKLKPSPIADGLGLVMENVGRVAADFFIHLCHLTRKAIAFQVGDYFLGPVGVLILLACLYYSIVYLEITLANSAEIVIEWLWPATHVTLRAIERCLRSTTNFVQAVDDLGESLYCDWAQLWCTQFDLMCHHRCSFTSKTLERLRH